MYKKHSKKYRSENVYWLHFASILLLLFITNTQAQQAPHYTQYLYNMQILNPAFVGSKADLSVSLLSRKQWVGLDGAPETTTFSVGGRTMDAFGLGATIIKDKIGLATSTNVNIDASYTIPTSRYGRLAFGLKGGLTFFNNNLSNGITPDNEIYASTEGNYPNVGFGALYYNDQFFVGLSVPNLLNTHQFKVLENIDQNDGISNNNYFLAAGYMYDFSEYLKFKPSTIIKYTPSLPVSVDMNANFIYNEKIELGLSYRYNNNISISSYPYQNTISGVFALLINKKYRVGYSYDHTFAPYGSNLSSHEIIIRFDFKFNRTTRWLFHNRCYF